MHLLAGVIEVPRKCPVAVKENFIAYYLWCQVRSYEDSPALSVCVYYAFHSFYVHALLWHYRIQYNLAFSFS